MLQPKSDPLSTSNFTEKSAGKMPAVHGPITTGGHGKIARRGGQAHGGVETLWTKGGGGGK
jgi:hypothetical protein